MKLSYKKRWYILITGLDDMRLIFRWVILPRKLGKETKCLIRPYQFWLIYDLKSSKHDSMITATDPLLIQLQFFSFKRPADIDLREITNSKQENGESLMIGSRLVKSVCYNFWWQVVLPGLYCLFFKGKLVNSFYWWNFLRILFSHSVQITQHCKRTF